MANDFVQIPEKERGRESGSQGSRQFPPGQLFSTILGSVWYITY